MGDLLPIGNHFLATFDLNIMRGLAISLSPDKGYLPQTEITPQD